MASQKTGLADGVVTIALDRPGLDAGLLSELLGVLGTAADDDAARCVVLRGTGPETFSTGADLAGLAAGGREAPEPWSGDLIERAVRAIAQLPKPTLCVVEGACLAGGLALALACDLVIAGEGATFGTPEIEAGVFPSMASALVARNVPRKRAAEMLLLGRRLDAKEALAFGLVNRIVKKRLLEESVREWSHRLAARSPATMRLGREALARAYDLPLAEALDLMREARHDALRTEDLHEGVRAFFERRPPRFTGR